MRPQIVQDQNGNPTGVFIPIKDWENIKKKYPNIEKSTDELPQWQKELIDLRLSNLEQHPGNIKSIEQLFDVIDEEV